VGLPRSVRGFGARNHHISNEERSKTPGAAVYGGPIAEKQTSQKIIQTITLIAFIMSMIVPGLDHRFAWSRVPFHLVVAGDVLVALGFLMIFFVYRENTFASATIEVYPEQKVISTGLYALVRHPMYVGGFIMFLGIPFSLGSWWGLFGVLIFLPAGIWRIFEEEIFLAKNLAGYPEYQNKVKHRLFAVRLVATSEQKLAKLTEV
jgi:protein-S-isoprenylcysteine O-methyltransferase Ste14